MEVEYRLYFVYKFNQLSNVDLRTSHKQSYFRKEVYLFFLFVSQFLIQLQVATMLLFQNDSSADDFLIKYFAPMILYLKAATSSLN